MVAKVQILFLFCPVLRNKIFYLARQSLCIEIIDYGYFYFAPARSAPPCEWFAIMEYFFCEGTHINILIHFK